MVREGYRKDGRGECVFLGTMVPFVRDWDHVEEIDGVQHVRPADLERVVGQALILHTKQCGDEHSYVVRLGEQDALRSSVLTPGLANMYAYDASTPKSLPAWLPQVHARLERLAASDSGARAALDAWNRGAAGEPEGAPAPFVVARSMPGETDNYELGDMFWFSLGTPLSSYMTTEVTWRPVMSIAP